MQRTPEQEEQEGYIRGYHDIPDDEKLKRMSFVELCAELASCSNGSPKFLVIDREIKKHVARDQSKAARSNIILGAAIAGGFTILGAAIGGILKVCPPCQLVAPAPVIQQVEKKHLPPVDATSNKSTSEQNTSPKLQGK